MLRVLFFGLIRIIIIALVIYFVLTIIRGIIRALQGPSRRSTGTRGHPQTENQPKSKEEYKDVKDAKFVELPRKNTENESRDQS